MPSSAVDPTPPASPIIGAADRTPPPGAWAAAGGQVQPAAPLGAGAGHPRSRLPLSVVQLVESHWVAGHRFHCERSEVPALELVLSGTMLLRQGETETLLGAGEVLVLRSGQAYTCSALGGPVHKLHLGLGGSWAEQVIGELPLRVVPGDAERVHADFAELRQLSDERPVDYHIRASTTVYRLLLQVSLARHGERAAAPINPLVAAAQRILETSGARDLDVRQVARTVGTSVSHLHRLFKEALGTSPLRYAREHLVRQAKDALGNTALPCRVIAERLGYDDPLYFSAVFKRVAGVSPREFRKRHR